ncbi:hypothetical protein XIS1_1450002 [Xenorhabdus innexi]|uniref:Uncharacterized protein n=1 Tax=Xenorhabdus innexi TaxID=290109 RepID=A0A1N6MUE6_9GAMM|nr:hypothetical protein XIS1_1450002 [Xenorhabdus innexi]
MMGDYTKSETSLNKGLLFRVIWQSALCHERISGYINAISAMPLRNR